ncbi:nuclear transport factor 2 family protein [Plastoroseomonas hellenica]|nr:nuclear transport factor 2 family protein [Plastoroseomonas hellenica]
MMGETRAATAFDVKELKRALEEGDTAALVSLYAEDAEMTVVDFQHSPSAPMRVTGKAAIEAFWRDVCGRDMTHRVGHEVAGPDRISFVEECAYPDGCRVMAAMTLDLSGGRIARHLTVQAWDGASAASG